MAATPSLSVKPIATPMAKSSGRLAKIALPDDAITCETLCGSHEKFALPTPSRMPATGSTETGSIMHLPIFCMNGNAFFSKDMSVPVAFERLRAGGRDERPYVGRGIRHERRLGQPPTLVEPQRADLRLDVRYLGHADAEF